MTSRQLDEEAIFHIARQLESSEARSVYLDQVCAGDLALQERVKALLEIHEQEQSFLNSDAASPAATEDAPRLSERPGGTIGRYKLMEQIGEGGMGVIFVAQQERPLRRKVALKVIKPGMDSKAVVARFEAERQALAMMDHPNIAKVLDAGTTESGRPYFAMELVKGVPITEYCDTNNLLIRQRLELFVQVCQAIQHAHQKGIIHRDIKPSNVLVTLHDGQPVPKVIDFGVAKALNARLTDRTIYTEHLQIVGTLLYMSPEQAEMSGLDIDTRSDIYSLGVLLYELLTGTTPFQKNELDRAGFDEQRRLIREKEPPRASVRISSLGETAGAFANHCQTDPKRLVNQLRYELDWILSKAMEKDRTRRYDAATDFANDVTRFLNNDPVEACSPSIGYRLTKGAKRHAAALLVTALVAISLVGGTGVALWKAREAKAEAERAIEALRVATELAKEQAIMRAMAGQESGAEESLKLIEDDSIREYWRHVVRGQSALFKGDTTQAIDCFTRACESPLEESKVAAAAMLAAAYVYHGDGIRYLEQYHTIADAEPADDLDRFFLGQAFMWVDAPYAYQEIGNLFSDRGIGLVVRAEVKAHMAQATHELEMLENAQDDLEFAVRLMPDSPYVYQIASYISLVGYQIGERAGDERTTGKYVDLGRTYAERLVDNFSDHAVALAFAGRFYGLIGDQEDALEVWEMAKSRGLRGFWLIEYLHFLESIGRGAEAQEMFSQLEGFRSQEIVRYAPFIPEKEKERNLIVLVDASKSLSLQGGPDMVVARFLLGDENAKPMARELLNEYDGWTQYERRILTYLSSGQLLPAQQGTDTRDNATAEVSIALAMIREGKITSAVELLDKIDKSAAAGTYFLVCALQRQLDDDGSK